MTEVIRGIVRKNPIALENCCLFALEEEEGMYLVVSTDRQAGKDNIFVEKGQEMIVQGSVLEDAKFRGVLFTQDSKIKIKKVKKFETF